MENYLKIYSYKEKIIIANKYNGAWIRVSKELYTYLKAMIENKKKVCEELDDDDKKFIENIILKMKSKNIIIDEKSYVKPQLISLQLTNRCNLRCIHCCMDAGDNDGGEMSTLEIKQIIDKIALWNPREVMISGGEPMIRKDFFNILLYLRKKYSGIITLSTNGLFITSQNAIDLVSNVDRFDISIDGYDERTCSIVRGKGVFKKVIDAIKVLKQYKAENITISMTFGDKNENWIDKFNKLAKELKVQSMCRIFSPVGRGADSKKIFSGMDNMRVFIPKSFFTDKSDANCRRSCCTAGETELFIDYMGNVYPCPSLIKQKYYMGNVLNEDIENLVKKFDNTKIIINGLKEQGINYSKCKNCEVRDFCWTCPGANEFFENEFALKDQCRQVKPILMKRIWEE